MSLDFDYKVYIKRISVKFKNIFVKLKNLVRVELLATSLHISPLIFIKSADDSVNVSTCNGTCLRHPRGFRRQNNRNVSHLHNPHHADTRPFQVELPRTSLDAYPTTMMFLTESPF